MSNVYFFSIRQYLLTLIRFLTLKIKHVLTLLSVFSPACSLCHEMSTVLKTVFLSYSITMTMVILLRKH